MTVVKTTGKSEIKTDTTRVAPVRIIACRVFSPLLNQLQLERSYPHIRITYLPSNLHMFPLKLKDLIQKEIIAAKKSSERIICLYGECFPDMDLFCLDQGVIKVPGHTCYEMLLGKKVFQDIMDTSAGTFFLERDLILNFEEYCIKPLELQDEEMRSMYFKNYVRVVYMRQPSDPDLSREAAEIAEFLGLPLGIAEADYQHIEKVISKLTIGGR